MVDQLKVFVVGDSITNGTTVTLAQMYPSLLSSAYEMDVDWFGLPGTHSAVLDTDDASIFFTPLPALSAANPPVQGTTTFYEMYAIARMRDPDYVILQLGINDPNVGTTKAQFKANILALAVRARDAGAGQILPLGPFVPPNNPEFSTVIGEYNDALDELAVEHSWIAANATMAGLLIDPDDFSDGLHPNAAGHAKIAAFLDATLPRPAFAVGGVDGESQRAYLHSVKRSVQDSIDFELAENP